MMEIPTWLFWGMEGGLVLGLIGIMYLIFRFKQRYTRPTK